MFPKLAQWQPYLFGLGMSAFSVFMMGAGTLGIPRRHWDITFAGNALAHEWPGTAYLMLGLTAIAGIAAVVGGAFYIVIAVGSIFLGKRIDVPAARRVPVREGMAPPPAPAPAIPPGHANVGIAGFVAPGTFALAMVFLVSFMLYYFVNWKYLSTVWPLK
jgi:cytochrome c oxidase subunit 1